MRTMQAERKALCTRLLTGGRLNPGPSSRMIQKMDGRDCSPPPFECYTGTVSVVPSSMKALISRLPLPVTFPAAARECPSAKMQRQVCW